MENPTALIENGNITLSEPSWTQRNFSISNQDALAETLTKTVVYNNSFVIIEIKYAYPPKDFSFEIVGYITIKDKAVRFDNITMSEDYARTQMKETVNTLINKGKQLIDDYNERYDATKFIRETGFTGTLFKRD